jgi:septum formation protein
MLNAETDGEQTLLSPSLTNNRNPVGEPGKEAELILASRSPRRAELLNKIIKSFHVIPSNIKENFLENESPETYVLRVSREKAESVSGGVEAPKGDCWVLAGDTVVVLEGTILGKPEDADDARRMLECLQDRRHEVITGICLLNRKAQVCCLETVCTQVWMRRIEAEEIESYIQTGEPFDKAGGYAIQGQGGRFVRRFEGSYTNVVGLPTERLQVLLRKYRII